MLRSNTSMTESGSGDDPFVSVLRSSDAQLVQTVIAALRAEGIPCEHPGLNHAALLPGFTYIEVDLRVRQSRHADALALIAELRSDGDEDEEARARGATFRVRRSNSGLYVIIGMVLAIMSNVVVGLIGYHFWPVARGAMFAAAIIGGYLLGQARRADFCSRPDCGGPLRGQEERCPKCKTPIRGELRFASEHFDAADAWKKAHGEERAS